MRIVQITPGSGDNFYCENCVRDNGSIQALRRSGHDALMVPMYLPPLADQPRPQTVGPIFFGGINVYLQQKFSLFRRTPRWLDRLFDSPRLLKWVGRKASMTNARALGETTLSMLRGEHGRQVKELGRLVEWLGRNARPDVVVLSNALLVGLARQIRMKLGCPVVCMLQDEDFFLDVLPEPLRDQSWAELSQRSADVDCFVAVSNFYADVMRDRLGLPAGRVRVVHNCLPADDYMPADAAPDPPVVGFLSRMCPEKGLDTLVEAFVILRGDARLKGLRLRAAGGSTVDDDAFLDGIRRRLDECGLLGDVELLPNMSLPERQAFLPTLSVLSVPERRGQAFGLYILEALASGVPVVLPRSGAAVELLEATGGGTLYEPNDPPSLAAALAKLLADTDRARDLGARGRRAVLEKFNAERIAGKLVGVFQEVASRPAG